MRAQEFDINSFENPYARLPLIGGILKSLAVTKARTVAQFDTVKGQVEVLASSVEKTAAMLEERNDDYQKMYDGVMQEHNRLGLFVAAIELAIADAEREVAELGDVDGDLMKSELLATVIAGKQAMEKRRDDLSVLKHSSLQMLPMVRVIQYNNLALMDKFSTIKTLTLPAWKRTFLMWLALKEQEDSVELANSIDEATNKFLKANADLLHQNSVATAKSTQSLVIDIDTLKHVHNKIIDTLHDVQTVHLDGAAERAKAIAELAEMRQK